MILLVCCCNFSSLVKAKTPTEIFAKELYAVTTCDVIGSKSSRSSSVQEPQPSKQNDQSEQ